MQIQTKNNGTLLSPSPQEATRERSKPEVKARESRQPRHWLEIVEWVTLASSVVGTVGVAISGQVLNAVVGSSLAMTISASLVNRHRILQQNRQQTEAAIADVHQVIQSLYYQFQKLAAEPTDIEPMHQTLYHLARVTDRLESRAASAEDVEAIGMEVSLMRSAIFDLQGELQGLADKSVDIAPIQEQIDKIHQRLEALPAPFDPRELYGKIAELEQKNQNIVKPYLTRLVRQVKQLEQRNVDLSNELEILTEQFYNRPELKQMQGLQGIVAQLVKNVDRLQNLPEAESLSKAIANLSYKLDSLSEPSNHAVKSQQIQEVSEELAQLPRFREIEELQGVLAKLNGSENVKADAQKVPASNGSNGTLGKKARSLP